MLLSIELKSPETDSLAILYNHDIEVQKVIELVNKYQIGPKTVLTSFTPRVLQSIIKASNTRTDRS